MKRYSQWNEGDNGYIPYSLLIDLSREYLKTGFLCHYCGKPMHVGIPNAPNGCTLDHITPLSRGGTNDIENLVLCCSRCNYKKDKKGSNKIRGGEIEPVV
jgi:5-methylcytosine-specific restriction endonuclease McrA